MGLLIFKIITPIIIIFFLVAKVRKKRPGSRRVERNVQCLPWMSV